MKRSIPLSLRRWKYTRRLSPSYIRSPPFLYQFQQCRRYASTNTSNTSTSSTSLNTTENDEFKSITTPTTIPIKSSTPSGQSSQSSKLAQPATRTRPRLHLLNSLISSYSRSQAQHPYWTQFLSALAIYLLGDISAQSFSGDSDSDSRWDIPRTARTLIIGGLASIPGYKWFLFLSHNFNYTSSIRSVATKVVVNQIVFAPVFSTYYFGMSCVLSGGTPGQVWIRIKDTVPTTLWNSLFVWPWFQTFNFTFVKAEMRAVTSGLFAVGWQAYLSWLNRIAERRRQPQMSGTGMEA